MMLTVRLLTVILYIYIKITEILVVTNNAINLKSLITILKKTEGHYLLTFTNFTFKVQICTFSVQVTFSIVLETTTDWQLFDFTRHTVTNVAVFTRAPFLSLSTQTCHFFLLVLDRWELKVPTHHSVFWVILTGATMVQVACSWQPPLTPEVQGSMGRHVNPSPEYPRGHVHTTFSPFWEQRATLAQPPFQNWHISATGGRETERRQIPISREENDRHVPFVHH